MCPRTVPSSSTPLRSPNNKSPSATNVSGTSLHLYLRQNSARCPDTRKRSWTGWMTARPLARQKSTDPPDDRHVFHQQTRSSLSYSQLAVRKLWKRCTFVSDVTMESVPAGFTFLTSRQFSLEIALCLLCNHSKCRSHYCIIRWKTKAAVITHVRTTSFGYLAWPRSINLLTVNYKGVIPTHSLFSDDEKWTLRSTHGKPTV